MQFWEMKPVQYAAKSVAAGSACAAVFLAFRTTSRLLLGNPDTEALQALREAVSEDLQELCDQLDPTMLEALARLSPFRRFEPDAFDHILRTAYVANLGLKEEYKQRPLSASASFRIRAEYQKIIEAVRVFRAFIEMRIDTALEDFDEVAVDINALVEQACTDAVQDTFT